MNPLLFCLKKTVSIFFILLFLITTAQAANFGAEAQAAVQEAKNSLPLSFSPPFNARELATNAEIILISGYEPANRSISGATINVEINRPGSKVLLILTSGIKVHWQVTASPSTIISGIVTWKWGRAETQETPTITASIWSGIDLADTSKSVL